MGEEGQVIAIEPMPENARLLARNVRANGYKNISIHELAIGEDNGTARMYVSEKSNWHALNPVPWRTTETTVHVSTLDALIDSCGPASADLVRMDLEGYETVVDRGMPKTIATFHPKLVVDLHPDIIGPPAIVDYLQHLKRLGYQLEWAIDVDRDMPWRWLFLSPEKMTLDDLSRD